MATPHIILFADLNCGGQHTHVCEGLTFIGSYFNDITSSFVILEGNWQFFEDANFVNQMGNFSAGHSGTLGPGIYNWIEDPNALGSGTNDRLSSLKPV